MLRRICWIFLLAGLLAGCGSQSHSGAVRIATIAGPETDLIEVAKQVAAQRYHLHIEQVTFTDYMTPNNALAEGEVEVNIFQHQPYLDFAADKQGYQFATIGKTFVYPMGLYSSKHQSLVSLPPRAVVAIPNDPTNQARALLLLARAKLIQVRDLGKRAALELTPADITANPKQLQIRTLDAATLARVLADVDIAAINTNFAVAAGLYPNKDALFIEDKHSPYANIIVIRQSDRAKPWVKPLLAAVNSFEVRQAAVTLFKHQAIPAW